MAKIYITQKAEGEQPKVKTLKTKLSMNEIIHILKQYDKGAVVL